jgi:hypothetical protein
MFNPWNKVNVFYKCVQASKQSWEGKEAKILFAYAQIYHYILSNVHTCMLFENIIIIISFFYRKRRDNYAQF